MNEALKLNTNNLEDPANIIRLFNRINILEKKIAAIENGDYRSNVAPSKPKKPLTQIGNYTPMIMEELADGKIHSVYQIFEEVDNKQKLNGGPAPKLLSLQNRINEMSKMGMVQKIANLTYRKI